MSLHHRTGDRAAASLAAVAGLLAAWTVSAFAQSDCPDDRPCFNGEYQHCHDVVFQFTGNRGGWDLYNVRYRNMSGGETQVENESGTFTIPNAQPNTTYTVSVQGCRTHVLGPSTCTPWVSDAVTTVGDFGPDTCRAGLVWRGVSPADHVCVAPERRDAVADENLQAASHRAGAGPFGPDTCNQGFVWRGAFQDDRACVTPQARQFARDENDEGARRKLCP